jgi:hypothetical protein
MAFTERQLTEAEADELESLVDAAMVRSWRKHSQPLGDRIPSNAS